MYVENIIESIGLQIEYPMRIQVNNKGTKDLMMNNWSVGGRNKTHRYWIFLHERVERAEYTIDRLDTI